MLYDTKELTSSAWQKGGGE